MLPVKRLDHAKTRLGDALPRRELALSFALDTAAAARECRSVSKVVVVTSDPYVHEAITQAGFEVRHDQGADLNTALGLVAVRTGRVPVAIVTADLPALRATELADALRASASSGNAFVPDTPGTGTVLLAATEIAHLKPRFGPDSARHHEATGATRLPQRWPSLSRDVDTPSDLAEAVRLGVGPHTAQTLAVSKRSSRD